MKEKNTYENLGSWTVPECQILRLSLVSMMSSRWYSRASWSVGRWETRSAMSKIMELKPDSERKISWWSGTWRIVLFYWKKGLCVSEV